MAALRKFRDDIIATGLTRLRLMQKTVVALAEVCRKLNMPFEILGHTTNSNMVPDLHIDEDIEDVNQFSRYAPFKGYVFKEVGDKEPPASVFTKVDMQDNLDGEGVLWAADRIQKKAERTKLMIVLSDGFPAAKYSNDGELSRHLYMVCKHVERFENEGLFLWGIGVNSDMVNQFFKNSSVINDATDLPKATLGIVEHVLCNIVQSLG